MDIKELRQKNAQELNTIADELRIEVRDLRTKAQMRSLRAVRTLRVARKNLARVMFALASST